MRGRDWVRLQRQRGVCLLSLSRQTDLTSGASQTTLKEFTAEMWASYSGNEGWRIIPLVVIFGKQHAYSGNEGGIQRQIGVNESQS